MRHSIVADGSVLSAGIHRGTIRHGRNLGKGEQRLPIVTEGFGDAPPKSTLVTTAHAQRQFITRGPPDQDYGLHHALGAQSV